MDFETAKRVAERSLQIQSELSKLRKDLTDRSVVCEKEISELTTALGDALVAHHLKEIKKSDVDKIRQTLAEFESVFKEITIFMEAIDRRDDFEKKKISDPLAIIRNRKNSEIANFEYFKAKEQLLDLVGEDYKIPVEAKSRKDFEARRALKNLEKLAGSADQRKDYDTLIMKLRG